MRIPCVSFLKYPKVDLYFFCNHLASLLSSGYTLPEALQSLRNVFDPQVVEKLLNSVDRGQGLGNGMRKLPKLFPLNLIKLVGLGEVTGFLPPILNAAAQQEQHRKKLVGKILKAVAYPAIILALGLLLIIYMIFGILPSFQTIFGDLNATPPPITRFLLALPIKIYQNGPVIILFLAGVAWLLFKSKATWQNHLALYLWHKRAFKLFWLAKCFWLTSLCLSVGIPLLTALKQVRIVISNTAFRKEWSILISACQQGKAIQTSALEAGFPADTCSLLSVVERHGDLSGGLHRISEQYHAELEHFLDKLSLIIEPLVIIITGSMVGIIIINLLQPMMQLTQQFL